MFSTLLPLSTDIAIAAPYGGEDKKGLVYIFNGRSTGLNSVPSQILEGQWAAQSMPPSFGYSMKGATDVDENGYPGTFLQIDMALGLFGSNRTSYSVLIRHSIKCVKTAEAFTGIINSDKRNTQPYLMGVYIFDGSVQYETYAFICLIAYNKISEKIAEAISKSQMHSLSFENIIH